MAFSSSGIELNTDGEDGELHILGYCFDPDHPSLLKHIRWRKEERTLWAKKMIARLRELKYDITFEDVTKYAKGDVIVRTHIAEALVERGYFKSTSDAYYTLLVKGQPAYVPREPFSATDAIALIHNCGGEAFLAHPGVYSFPFDAKKLINDGLDGIEVYHSKHRPEQIRYWYRFAKKHKLFISGGSDHHGPYSRSPYPIGSIQLDEQALAYWTKKQNSGFFNRKDNTKS